jgi:hypothetical protein
MLLQICDPEWGRRRVEEEDAKCLIVFNHKLFVEMKNILFFLFAILFLPAAAQLEEGYSKKEVCDMIALCNSFSFQELFNSDAEIIPPEYKRIYTSPVLGMDNKYQIYRNGMVAVINIRGSTAKKLSWLENFYSSMIPAKGKIVVNGKANEYCFSKEKNAAVHCGYALAIVIMSNDILPQIGKLNKQGLHTFIITGHSQGGALSHMLRAYLENLGPNKISKKNVYKTYAFACPMIGNKEFVTDYNAKYCATKSSYTIINPSDVVTLFPITYKDGTYVTSDDLKTLLFKTDSFSFSGFAFNLAVNFFEKHIAKTVNYMGNSLSKEISKDIGKVELPKPLENIGYHRMSNVIEIAAAEYPKILKDSTILKNDSLMKTFKRDAEGNFLKNELYEKESMFYQHKPYNYYKTILKMYYPEKYKGLKRKFINVPVNPEN